MTTCNHKVNPFEFFDAVRHGGLEVHAMCRLCGNDVYALWIDEREDKSAHWSAWKVRD